MNIERHYLSCKRGHSTFYKNIDEMPSSCPMCSSSCWPTLVPVAKEKTLGLIVLGVSLGLVLIGYFLA